MSYIPPHKRHSNDPTKPSPVPDSLPSKFKKALNFKSSSPDRFNRIKYSGHSISKWFLVSSDGIDDEIPPCVKLVPLSSDAVECRNGEKPSILVKENMNTEEGKEETERSQFLLVAEKVVEDLVSAYEQAKSKEMEEHHHHVLRLVARSGKIFFYGSGVGPVANCSRKVSNKMFSTDVPTSYLHYIKSTVVPKHGLCADLEKDTYIVKVVRLTRPNETINCKCTLKEDGRLCMYKADLGLLRHLVVDVSCVDKNLDMRLMLAAKRKITSLTEEEMDDIRALLDTATVDPNVKGGLRWPLGKASCGDGYSVFEACHVRASNYKSKTLRLRVRETDRFNETSGRGEMKREVTLMLKDINTKMQEQSVEKGHVVEMLKDALGILWDLLHCDAYLT